MTGLIQTRDKSALLPCEQWGGLYHSMPAAKQQGEQVAYGDSLIKEKQEFTAAGSKRFGKSQQADKLKASKSINY